MLEISDVLPDCLKIADLFVVCENLVDLRGIDVTERDAFKNVFGTIKEDDDKRVLCFLHDLPARPHGTAWRRGDHAIPTFATNEHMPKRLRDIAPETVDGQMALPETLNRGPEISLDLSIQIVEPAREEIGQSRSDGGLADAGNAAKKESSWPVRYEAPLACSLALPHIKRRNLRTCRRGDKVACLLRALRCSRGDG